MAVSENITSQYYKVLEDDCFVYNGFVFVTVARYPSQEEREREKAREEELSIFVSNVNNRYLTLVAENDANESLTEEEAEHTAEIERVLYAVENFAVIVASQQPAIISISDSVKQELIELGYKDEFLSDPISTVSLSTVVDMTVNHSLLSIYIINLSHNWQNSQTYRRRIYGLYFIFK